jgi:SAM-dependent methyltransferase
MNGALFVDSGVCWVCGGQRGTVYHDALFDLRAYEAQDRELSEYSGMTVSLRRCLDCGFGQPERLPSLPRFFDRMYDQLWSSAWIENEFAGTYKDVIFRRILAVLRGHVPGGRRSLLDVGAHAGRFLDLARADGWTPEGLEVNPRTASYAATRTGLPVYRLNVNELPSLRRDYDAVTMTDVLEHIPDPVTTLVRVREKLRPGGWIAVKVPCGPAQHFKENCRARLAATYRPRLADNLVHVSHFSPASLRLALERAGFSRISIEVGAPECPPVERASTTLRLALYGLGRVVPFATHTPLALNLQAFASSAV